MIHLGKRKQVYVSWLGTVGFALLFGSFAHAQNENKKLKSKLDGEWITLSGKVTSVGAHHFTLKPNGKKVTVEMDDYDWDADGYKLVKGDQVIVNGRADKNFYSKNTIEASSVYVKSLDSYFYASAADEESAPLVTTTYFGLSTLPDGATADLRGTVTSINGDEFVLDTGVRKVTVETDSLPYNPLDKTGFVKIKVGDSVRVSGKVDDDFLEEKELKAKYIVDFS